MAQYGRSDLREQLRNIMHVARMAPPTNAAFAPAGNAGGYAVGSIQCLINVDAITTNNDPNCVPLNRLGLGVANPAAIDYVLGDPYRKQVLEQFVTGVPTCRSPPSRPGRAMSASRSAASIARRRSAAPCRPNSSRSSIPTARRPTAWSVGNYLPFKGSYNVKEAYLETVVPLGPGPRVQRRGARAPTIRTRAMSPRGSWVRPGRRLRTSVSASRARATFVRRTSTNCIQAGTANSDSVRKSDLHRGSGREGPADLWLFGPDYGQFRARRPETANSWNIGGVITPRFLPGFSRRRPTISASTSKMRSIRSARRKRSTAAMPKGTRHFCDAITNDPVRVQRQPFLIC
jgi:iron complex outermembrane receptor protein